MGGCNCENKNSDEAPMAGALNPYADRPAAAAMQVMALKVQPPMDQKPAIPGAQQGGALVPCTTPDGIPGMSVPGGHCYPCLAAATATGGDCSGPGNFNADVVASDLTQSDVDRVTAFYGHESATLLATSPAITQVVNAAGVAVANWYRIDLGMLGVSHTVGFTKISGDTGVDDIPVAISNMALSAERFAEEDGEGFRVWTNPKAANPDDIEVKDGHCSCKTLRQCVPEDAREGLLFRSTNFVLDGVGSVTYTVDRMDWLTRCAPCLKAGESPPPVGGRIVSVATAERRSADGFLP